MTTAFVYRQARPEDIAGMAEVRAGDWGSEAYWRERIAGYLAGEVSPRQALPHPGRSGDMAAATRIGFVCADGRRMVGLIAGHLTRRHGCSGELQWISVRPEYRGRAGTQARPEVGECPVKGGIASELLRLLAGWFVAHDARRVCVDVEPSNPIARRFYARHGAVVLKPHWMVWEDIGGLSV